MSNVVSRVTTGGAIVLAALLLAACEGPPRQEAPPMASADTQPAPPALLGGPPSSADVTMAPIANPEDMSPAERARVYGYRYSHGVTHHRVSPTLVASPPAPVVAAPAPVAAAPIAAAPAPTPVATPAPSFHAPDLTPLVAWLGGIWTRLVTGVAHLTSAIHLPGLPRLPNLPSLPSNIPGAKLLANNGVGDIDIPGLGHAPAKSVALSVLLVIAMILMALIARASAEQKKVAERRRKFRTMTPQHSMLGLDPEPEPVAPATPASSFAWAPEPAAAPPPVAHGPVAEAHHVEAPVETVDAEHAATDEVHVDDAHAPHAEVAHTEAHTPEHHDA